MDEGRRKQQSWQWTFSELCMCLYGCVRGSFLPPGVPLLLPPPPRCAQRLGSSPRVVRVMPNTPCLVSEAASALCGGAFSTPDDVAAVRHLLGCVGVVHVVTEPQMDGKEGAEDREQTIASSFLPSVSRACGYCKVLHLLKSALSLPLLHVKTAVTGLSGSGPAFVFMMIEALADGGVRAGLPRAVALSLATQLVKGSATMVQTTGKHPAELKDAVCSPGGTTIAGVHALEKGGLRAAVMDAVVAASNRCAELRK
jgi:pyrroline-5-carboxylate reductase